MISHHASLVRLRTSIKNRVHALLAIEGIQTSEFSDLFAKRGMEFLRRVKLRQVRREVLDNYLEVLKALEERIEEMETIFIGVRIIECDSNYWTFKAIKVTILHGDTMIDMNLNDEKGTDPTVEAIVEMFPEDFLRNTARESVLVIRERKIDPVILFWMLTLGFGVRFLSTIRGLKRKYEEKAGVKLSISSFYS